MSSGDYIVYRKSYRVVSKVRAERWILSRNGSFGELQARGSEGCAVTMQHKMQCNANALHCAALRCVNFRAVTMWSPKSKVVKLLLYVLYFYSSGLNTC